MSNYADQVFDFNRPAKEILLERFNIINGTQFKHDHFVLGQPELQEGSDRLTKVWVNPVLNSPWIKSFYIVYDRMPLNEVFAFQNKVSTGQANYLYDILDQINQAYGIYLTQLDVEQNPIIYTKTDDKTSAATVILRAKSTSYLYLGEHTLNLNVETKYGVSTFEQELLHFIVYKDLQDQEKIKLKAFSSLGHDSVQFIAAKNTQNFTIVEFRDMFFTELGHLVLLGKFNFIKTENADTQTITNATMVQLNQAGDVVKFSLSSTVFGVANPKNTVLISDDCGEGKFWSINITEGNRHQLIRYNLDGTRFTVTDTSQLEQRKLSKVVCFDQYLYGFGNVDRQGFIVRFDSDTGVYDATFAIKQPQGIESVEGSKFEIIDMVVDEKGIHLVGNNLSQTNDLIENTLQASYTPLRSFDHDGEILEGYLKTHKGLSSDRVGSIREDTKIASVQGGLIFIGSGLCNRSCIQSKGIFGCSSEGKIANNAADYLREQLPYIENNAAIFIEGVGKGQAYCAAQSSWIPGAEQTPSIWIGMYGSDGNFSGKVTHLENTQLLAYRVRRY